jgi:hypothetical protein
MVSTRNHPSQFPAPATTPSKAGTPSPPSPTPRAGGDAPPSGWTHTATPLTLLWLAVSLPLVAWDTGYVLLRPHSMPGGALHWPVWQPYALYGTVDHVYGFPAWSAGDGFCGAQGTLNVVESAMYVVYVVWVLRYGRRVDGDGGLGGHAAATGATTGLQRVLAGKWAGRASLLAFSAAVMTLSKTVLYCTLFPSLLRIRRAIRFGVARKTLELG